MSLCPQWAKIRKKIQCREAVIKKELIICRGLIFIEHFHLKMRTLDFLEIQSEGRFLFRFETNSDKIFMLSWSCLEEKQ